MGDTSLKETKEEKDLSVLVHKSRFPSSVLLQPRKGTEALGMIKRNFPYRSKEVIVKLYKSLVRPHLDYAIQACNPHLEKDVRMLEKVQARATKLIPNLKHSPTKKDCASVHNN